MSTRSDAAQDFSRLTSEEFDGLWGQKARETLSTFQRILTDYERGIWQQGVNQILNQISSGATTIDNPLRSGFIGGLEYVENYFPTLYKHFNALFGDNDTLDVSQVADYYGISSETLQQFGIDLYRDPVSLLPRKVAIQIFSHLNIVDLTTCGLVCMAWKVLTAAPSLWSHLDFYRVRHRFAKNDKAVIGKFFYQFSSNFLQICTF